MTAAVNAGPDNRRMMLAAAALVAGAVALGASPIFVRVADVGPYASAFWRTFLALPFLYAWTKVETGGASLPAPDRTVLLAGLLFAGDLFFWHLAILSTTVANAAFLATTTPIWVALGAWLFLSEKVSRANLIGIVLCLIGGSALLGNSYNFAPEHFLGDIYGVVTAFFFGTYILTVGQARMRYGAAVVMLYSTAIASLCLFLIAFFWEPHVLPRTLTGAASVLALALVSQVIGRGLIVTALGTMPTTFSSLVIFLEAVAAAGFGWLIFSEALGTAQLTGGLLIFAGIWIARPRASSRLNEVQL
jgi:drug/metabolite transporter (DMT)-like permease